MQRGPGFERGAELGGRYRLDEPIGAGAMGEVWRAFDLRLRRPVAIKILKADLATEQAAVARFRREAETTAALQHPGITVIFDIDEHPDGERNAAFLVMELLTGRDLHTFLNGQSGGVPVEQAVSLAAQAADALAAAHSHGVIHRDIKPANLFLLDDGRLKVCDFGIARLADATTRLTATGGFVGTPLYMAPEQFRGQHVDARADLYSLGCVMYELFAGASPFNVDTNPAAIMYQHLNEAPASLRSRRPDLPEHLERLTTELLAKDPADRPANAAAVVAALRGDGGGHPPVAFPANVPLTVPDDSRVPAAGPMPQTPAPPTTVPPSEIASPPGRGRRRGLVVGATVAAVAVLAAGGAYALLNGSTGHKALSRATTPVSAPSTPGVPSDRRPVVPGWHVMPAPGYGVAYDLPPGWKLEQPGTYVGFEDSDGNALAGEKAAASLMRGKCTRAQTGLRGGSVPEAKPSSDQLLALGGAADEQARKWASAAYGTGDEYARPPKLKSGQNDTVTVNGITAARVTYTVTTTDRPNACAPSRAFVESLAMAATKNASTVGPLIFTVFADRGVTGQVTNDELTKIIGSIRPFQCAPGTATHNGDNKCSP